MNDIGRDLESIPPIPWDIENVCAHSCPSVTEYPVDAFEISFAEQPIDAIYSAVPRGCVRVSDHQWGACSRVQCLGGKDHCRTATLSLMDSYECVPDSETILRWLETGDGSALFI